MLTYIDKFLNKYTMYKVVLYALLILAAYSLIVDFAWNKVVSLVILMVGSYMLNQVIGRILKAPVGSESSTITGLILYLILAPYATIATQCLVVVIAMFSKYIFAWKKRHIFNPAAFVVALAPFVGIVDFTWWIASPIYLPLVAVLGLLVVRKTRRMTMFLVFVVVAAGIALAKGVGIAELFISFPIIYFGAFMLTEPASTPPTQKLRLVYAVIVGVLFNFYFEWAIVIGNIFSFIVSPKDYKILKFLEKNQLANGVVEYVFMGNVKFTAGQYAEWTVPHDADSRGNRRYFTIASSPTEEHIRIGIREGVSSFKKALDTTDKIVVSQVAGEFVLPKDKNIKLAFLAGGIGVTPFRSMIQYLIDTGEQRDIVLFYGAEAHAYKDVFAKYPIKVEYVSRIEKVMLEPYKDRQFYISGPNVMVDVFKKMLKEMGVKKIITDYFPGY